MPLTNPGLSNFDNRVIVTLSSHPSVPIIAGRATAESEAKDGEKVRLESAGRYEAGSWGRERRVVYKAEAQRVQRRGKAETLTNTRFVVTSRGDEPETSCEAASGNGLAKTRRLYDWYVDRGEAEGWIKNYKVALKSDRLSCHRFLANQFRLLLHAAAYWLLDTLRRKLMATGTVRMQLDTLRLRLIKIAGRVRQLPTA